MRCAIVIAGALVALFALVGCGGSEPETVEPEPEPVGDGTTGGETAETVVMPPMRTTTPIPVPQPAVPRERLSAPLQTLWDRVEEAVNVRPPDPPAESTREAIEAWAQGPFTDWVGRRAEAVRAVEAAQAPLASSAGAERGVAAALFGYVYEETAAGARGAPVPADLASDPELIRIYQQSLVDSLRPYAQASAESYAACVQVFAALQQAPWAEWGQYCLDRGRDVIEVYGLAPAPPDGATTTPPPDGAAPAD